MAMPFNLPINDWRGKTVWLVGASSGIGRATAHALHGQGAKVIVSARNQQALDTFAAEHPGATVLAMDASDAASVEAAAQTVLSAGPLDLVLYCAGYYKEMRATQFDLANMLRHNQVNYVGALYLLSAVLPHFLARKAGHISLVSSVAGYRGFSNGSLDYVGSYGGYWSSTVSSTRSRYLYFDSGYAGVGAYDRALGGSVRCLKD